MNDSLYDLIIKAYNGNVDAQYTLAVKFQTGNEIIKDDEKMLYWLKKAAEKDKTILYLLGTYYIGKKEYREAFLHFHTLATLEYGPAQYYLARLYYYGYGVEQDRNLTLKWIIKATANNYPKAKYFLGYCYVHGYYVNKDTNLAFKLFLAAAQAKYIRAQFYTSFCYLLGMGIEKDIYKSIHWFNEFYDNINSYDHQYQIHHMYCVSYNLCNNIKQNLVTLCDFKEDVYFSLEKRLEEISKKISELFDNNSKSHSSFMYNLACSSGLTDYNEFLKYIKYSAHAKSTEANIVLQYYNNTTMKDVFSGEKHISYYDFLEETSCISHLSDPIYLGLDDFRVLDTVPSL